MFINHSVENSDFFLKILVPKIRYGNSDENDIRRFRSVFATKDEVQEDLEFLMAIIAFPNITIATTTQIARLLNLKTLDKYSNFPQGIINL